MPVFPLFIALGLLTAPQDPAPPDLGARLRAHVRFLADDLLEGRDTPSKGLDIAALYIAGEFEKAGLKPGNGESWFQETDQTNRRSAATGKVRNVIGVLPGTDPKLKEEFVLVTAHYDHLGKRDGEGDRLYNGANDNASGTAGVIEVANLLRSAKPKRSIVFMCFWGEEQGLLGSRHYAANPVFPLVKTVAMINLEQIGRTDDSEGDRTGAFNVTGYDYSDLSVVLRDAARKSGVEVTKHERNSDPYFFASDNAALAGAGVPAHTVSTSYSFPDYHQPGDEWSKLNYPNYSKIVFALAEGVRTVADRAEPIAWSETVPRAKRYLDAWRKLHGGQ